MRLRNIFLSAEFWVAIAALVVGVAVALYIQSIGMTRIMVDQNIRLLLARLFWDGMTPGFSQLGYLPPLLTLALIPYVTIDALYFSGLAGLTATLPFFLIAAVLLFKTLRLLTEDRLLALTGTAVLIMNPYALYCLSTPLTETLFLSMLIITLYFMTSWMHQGGLLHLLLGAFCISLVCITRYEGLALLPITAIAVFIVTMRSSPEKRMQTEAVLLLFILLASLGVMGSMLYGAAFGGEPLRFLVGDGIANVQEEVYAMTGRPLAALVRLLFALGYVLGWGFVPVILLCIFALFYYGKLDVKVLSILAIAFAPFGLVLYVLITRLPLTVPDFNTNGHVLNARYAISSLPGVILAMILGLDCFLGYIRAKLPTAAPVVKVLCCIGIGGFAAFHGISTVLETRFPLINLETARIVPEEHDTAAYLREHYAGGKVLGYRYRSNAVFLESRIPLEEFIHESIFQYFDQALRDPWLFANWVIVREGEMGSLGGPLALKVQEPTFNQYYKLVYGNNLFRVFELQQDVLRQRAIDLNYDLSAIPTLNTEDALWDPATVYEEIRGER